MKAIREKNKFLNQIPTVMNPEGANMWGVLGKMIRGVANRRPSAPLETIETNWDSGLRDSGLGDSGTRDFYIWLGHSSVYLELDGIRILIDPVFSSSTSPIPFIGPKAFEYENSYKPEDFQDLDMILISHDHYDHLDKMAIKSFTNRAKQFITPLGVGEILSKWGVPQNKIREVDWGDELVLDNSLKIWSQPGRHFSGRGLLNRDTTLWCSYVIQSNSKKIFFSGDSGYGPHFKNIGETHGPFDLAFMECGQYNENWPLIHMMPEETSQAALDLKTRTFVPIHWGKFALSLHAWDEPPKRAAKEASRINQAISLPKIGERISI